ncbi:glycerol kinase, partial [Pseudomonas syringae pv. actinidiae]|nr:glycerol kinase [Pseudomonas syringae pv. actinidiae]
MNEHSPLILAIDEGTSNAKAVLVNEQGQVVARGSRPLSISHPQAGYSEQDPLLIWQATLEAIADCMTGLQRPISALAITQSARVGCGVGAGQRGTVVACISWQC